ncbi:uncharacterized protein PG986_000703 [Apiospora aurea]|uniref:Uncharacterized protein n=1 Tax=Apiospora aurea TaxID=335848 RepID=A0ABR1QUR6_9PEZI
MEDFKSSLEKLRDAMTVMEHSNTSPGDNQVGVNILMEQIMEDHNVIIANWKNFEDDMDMFFMEHKDPDDWHVMQHAYLVCLNIKLEVAQTKIDHFRHVCLERMSEMRAEVQADMQSMLAGDSPRIVEAVGKSSARERPNPPPGNLEPGADHLDSPPSGTQAETHEECK